jgi:hypothetical protein
MRVLTLVMTVVLSIAAIGRAEPLNLQQVAADAKWVMHVDLDALRASAVVQKAYHKCMEMQKDAEKHLDMVSGMIGMDPRKDFHGVTVYGKDTNKEHGVLVVHAKVNQQLLLNMVAMAPEHKVTRYGSYELHSWTHKCPKGKSRTVVGAFYQPDMIVFAACPEIVKAALNVLDGKAPAITGSESPLAGRTMPGSIFVARASAVDPKTRCPVLKQANSFRVAMGENNGQSFYRARLVMKSAESAEQVKAVVQGFKAMVSLGGKSDGLAMKLISGLNVDSEGTKVNVRWNASADDVWTCVEKIAKKCAEHAKKLSEQKHKGMGHGCPMCGAAAAGKCPIHGHGDAHKSKPQPQPKHGAEEF